MKKNKIIPIEEQLLSEISEFCLAAGITENAFGLKVVKSNKLVGRLQSGKGVWSSTINAVRNYIANHKPRVTNKSN